MNSLERPDSIRRMQTSPCNNHLSSLVLTYNAGVSCNGSSNSQQDDTCFDFSTSCSEKGIVRIDCSDANTGSELYSGRNKAHRDGFLIHLNPKGHTRVKCDITGVSDDGSIILCQALSFDTAIKAGESPESHSLFHGDKFGSLEVHQCDTAAATTARSDSLTVQPSAAPTTGTSNLEYSKGSTEGGFSATVLWPIIIGIGCFVVIAIFVFLRILKHRHGRKDDKVSKEIGDREANKEVSTDEGQDDVTEVDGFPAVWL